MFQLFFIQFRFLPTRFGHFFFIFSQLSIFYDFCLWKVNFLQNLPPARTVQVRETHTQACTSFFVPVLCCTQAVFAIALRVVLAKVEGR